MKRWRPRFTRKQLLAALVLLACSAYALYSSTCRPLVDTRDSLTLQLQAEEFWGQMTGSIVSDRPRTAIAMGQFVISGSGTYGDLSDGRHGPPKGYVESRPLTPTTVTSLTRTYPREKWSACRRLPQALIIGVKKGGTRALLEFIRLHPDVRAVGPETHFFDRHYANGLEWYRRHMPSSLESQITIEKTPSYFITKDVPRRVFNMSRDVKLLVVVRDPVTRAVSDYAQTMSKRQDIKPFEQLAFLNNVTGLVDTSWVAIKIGVYAKHLQRWLQFFPRRQLHFVSGEMLIKDPAGEMAKVQDFLGIRRIISENHFYFNETKGFPCLKKSERNGSPRCLGRTKGRTHPSIDPAAILRLREFYRPFNAKFFLMTGIDFGWP